MIWPIGLEFMQPPNLLWPLKSPTNKKGVGNWSISLLISVCSNLYLRGIYSEHIQWTVVFIAIACRFVFKYSILYRVVPFTRIEVPPVGVWLTWRFYHSFYILYSISCQILFVLFLVRLYLDYKLTSVFWFLQNLLNSLTVPLQNGYSMGNV